MHPFFLEFAKHHGFTPWVCKPRDPKRNPWVDHGNQELKAETGLRKGVLIHDHHYAARCLVDAILRLDGARPRASRGMRTAIAVDAALPRVYTASDRARFYLAACTAREEAVLHVQRTPDRITAAREAVLETLAGFGFVTRSIGGVPLPAPDRR